MKIKHISLFQIFLGNFNYYGFKFLSLNYNDRDFTVYGVGHTPDSLDIEILFFGYKWIVPVGVGNEFFTIASLFLFPFFVYGVLFDETMFKAVGVIIILLFLLFFNFKKDDTKRLNTKSNPNA